MLLTQIKSLVFGAALILLFLAVAACSGAEEPTLKQELTEFTVSLTSDAFIDGTGIPSKYTCRGANVSPPLSWSGIPEGAKSLALIVDDADAEDGVPSPHWVLFSLPADVVGLPDGVPATASTPEGGTNGTNAFDSLGYSGPCPRGGGPTHRYVFNLYALDNDPGLQSSATKADLFKAIDGHILAAGRLTGTYKRTFQGTAHDPPIRIKKKGE